MLSRCGKRDIFGNSRVTLNVHWYNHCPRIVQITHPSYHPALCTIIRSYVHIRRAIRKKHSTFSF